MNKTLADGRPYASDKLGFGIYHFAQGAEDARGYKDSENFPHDGADRRQCDRQERLDYMNMYIYRLDESCYDHLRRIKEMGCVTWVFYSPFVSVEIGGKQENHLKAGWRDEITKLVDGVKEAGLWDVVAGFQYDEPMLNVTTEVFEEFSSFMATFGKRQLAIFSYYEVVEGSNPRSCDPEYGKEAHLITPESCKYLTDIGFDWYRKFDYNEFKKLTDIMLGRLGRDDVYVWQVPTTWTFYDNKDFTEELCIESLEGCYKLLLDSKNPGGLFCYTWRSWLNVKEGLDYRFNTENHERWEKLEKRMMEIGKELREIKLNLL